MREGRERESGKEGGLIYVCEAFEYLSQNPAQVRPVRRKKQKQEKKRRKTTNKISKLCNLFPRIIIVVVVVINVCVYINIYLYINV